MVGECGPPLAPGPWPGCCLLAVVGCLWWLDSASAPLVRALANNSNSTSNQQHRLLVLITSPTYSCTALTILSIPPLCPTSCAASTPPATPHHSTQQQSQPDASMIVSPWLRLTSNGSRSSRRPSPSGAYLGAPRPCPSHAVPCHAYAASCMHAVMHSEKPAVFLVSSLSPS